MTIYLRYWAAGLLAAFAMTGTAYAGAVAGSDSVIVFNVGTSPMTDLLSAMAAQGSITFDTAFWASGSGNLSGIPSFTPISNTSLSLTTAGIDSFAFSSIDGSFVGAATVAVGSTVDTSEFTGSSGSVARGSETLSLFLVGIFTPAGSISNFAADTMSIALSLTENGITGSSPPNLGSFSASFTVATPAAIETPPVSIPEPLSVLLLATPLLFLRAIRRKCALVDANDQVRSSGR